MKLRANHEAFVRHRVPIKPFISVKAFCMFSLFYPLLLLLHDIHCFTNGNGRYFRLMADLIMEKLYRKTFFTWGNADLVKANETKDTYIKAVRKVDIYDVRPLISFANS